MASGSVEEQDTRLESNEHNKARMQRFIRRRLTAPHTAMDLYVQSRHFLAHDTRERRAGRTSSVPVAIRFGVARPHGFHYRIFMWPRIARILRHPIMMMVVLILLCRVVKNAYPFNSFPMYADPSPHPSDYLIVADAEGRPINVKQMTGLSSAKVKKIYTERLNRTCSKLDMEPTEATPEIREKVFTDTMRQLRELAEKRKRPLPDKVRITNVLIYQDYQGGAAFREEPQVLGEG